MAPTISAPITGKKLSSVVPGTVTAEEVKDYKLTNVDLALKLHYIRGFYIFSADSTGGGNMSIADLKKPMFPLLHMFYTASGRIRRSESGRPFIKCNDSGVRIVEANCEKTVEEWLDSDRSFDLVHDQVLGPDLGFSPLVYIQFTSFKCGGLSVGLSWAHVLGDTFSVTAFINLLGQFLQGHVPPKSIHVAHTNGPDYPLSAPRKPLSIKRVNPVHDCWITAGDSKIETHSFILTGAQLDNILSDIAEGTKPARFSHFELISAIIWKSLSKIREDSGIVTVCTRKSSGEIEFPSNKRMAINTVEVDFAAAKVGVGELAALISDKKVEENKWIEETVDSENDYILYGANLTFVNMKEADIYGLKLKGNKPVFANYSINGVGDGGAVVVLPGPENGDRTVTVMLPEFEVVELKSELKKEWNVV